MREASQGLALILVNELLSCYLAINNPRLCKPLTDWADKVATLDVNAGTFAQVGLLYIDHQSGCAVLQRERACGHACACRHESGSLPLLYGSDVGFAPGVRRML
jgi:hypothetical protein